MQLVAAESVLLQLLTTAVQKGDKQGPSSECLLRCVPTWISLQERSPNKAAHSLLEEAAADLQIAHPAAFASTSAPSHRSSNNTRATDECARCHHKLGHWRATVPSPLTYGRKFQRQPLRCAIGNNSIS